MNTLDSRTLRFGDCFGQRFGTPGSVRYFVTLGGFCPPAEMRSDDGYVITVKGAKKGAAAAPKQFNVVVSRKDGALVVTPKSLEIEAGDGVLWHAGDESVVGFRVSGAGDGFSFDSAKIQQAAVFTHVFGVPGVYQWKDPNGTGVAGTVEVAGVAPCRSDEDREKWYEALKSPAGFEIKGKSSKPEKLKITVGQTVFWSIDKSAGVAITDASLVAAPVGAKAG